MAFLETPRFPLCISYGAVGGPEYMTDIVEVNSGFEQRNQRWAQARAKYQIEFPLLDENKDLFLAWFRALRGRAHGFRLRDWADYQVSVADGRLGPAAAAGGAKTYQLYKHYSSGGALEEYRKIVKPLADPVALVYRGGVAQTPGVGAGQYALDTTTGQVSFVADASAIATAITVGATTSVTLASNPGGLTAGQSLYLSGFGGADAALVNDLAHTINSVSGSPPVFVLATNTTGKTITVGSGQGEKYAQAAETLAWSGEFDVPVRFDSDYAGAADRGARHLPRQRHHPGRDPAVKAISAGLRTHLQGEVTTWATCWRVTLTDGTVYTLTDHDADLVIDGRTYLASSGYSASAVQTASDLSVDNLELVGFLDSPIIRAEDFIAGLWDYAAINIFRVNWADLSQGLMHERRGSLGEVSLKRGQFQTELRGLMQNLTRPITELYSAGCRARLGDERCTVDLTEYTATGTVVALSSDRQFTTDLGSATVRLTPTTTGAPTDDYFLGGLLTFTSGLNSGLEMEVKSYTAASELIVLHLLMPFHVEPGDTFSVHAGCDKNLATCRDKFGNVINFRGEPYVPGLDQTLQVGNPY